MMLGVSKAATIGISAGFGATSGVLVTIDGVSVASTLEVGGWDGVTFTEFATDVALGSGAKIAGSFVASGPASLNSDEIFMRITAGGNTAIIATGSFFPSDVSSGTASTTEVFSSSAAGTISSFSGALSATLVDNNPSIDTLNFVTVPEPSIALLSALGVFGLVRRRRR